MGSKYIRNNEYHQPFQGKKSDENPYKEISLEVIRETVTKTFYGRSGFDRNDKPYDYYTPKEISPGLWQIGPLWTGDGGKAEFDKAVMEDLKKSIM